MSKAIPSKPPTRPFQPAYTVTTTARVPGRVGQPALADDVEAEAPEAVEAP